jgi:hypothetical protein
MKLSAGKLKMSGWRQLTRNNPEAPPPTWPDGAVLATVVDEL